MRFTGDYAFVSYTPCADPTRILRAVPDFSTGRDDVTVLLGTDDELLHYGSRVDVNSDPRRFVGHALDLGYPNHGYMYRVLDSDTVTRTLSEYINQPHLTDEMRALTPHLFGPRGLIA